MNFHSILSPLFIMAAISYAKAGESDEILKEEMEKKYLDAKVSVIAEKEQQVIGKLVNQGKDISVEILNKYDVAFDFTSDGKSITSRSKPRFMNGLALTLKPQGTPATDEEFFTATGLSVEGVVQGIMGEVADEAQAAIDQLAKGKQVKKIEVGVESVGYTNKKETYNVLFLRFTF